MTPDSYDAAIIGAGVIGCAIARRFALQGARVVVLEKAADVLDGASKANSAILHTGFDAPPGSLELACIQAGHAEYLEIHRQMNLPLLRTGAMVLAWTDEEEAALPALMAQARENGVTDVQALSGSEARRLEPGLAGTVRAGFRVPGESLIDPWSAPHAYLRQALENGGALRRSCAVTGGRFDGQAWRLETSTGAVQARIVVNAAGLYGDHLDALLIGRSDFRIRPRKGQFVVFDKTAAALAGHILLPVPGKTTKGIVVCRTAYGNLLVGPTAEEQEARDTADLVPSTLAALHARGIEILPDLARHPVTAAYAGLRPASEFKEYQIRAHAAQSYITVGAIRSTGLSSALGTARHVHDLAVALGLPGDALERPLWPVMPSLCDEAAPRDWTIPGHGGIVCHCEQVTWREVDAALSGPMAARSLAGLKRRTRVTMGRCQGFYCTAALARITEGRLAEPMSAAISPAEPSDAG